MIPAEALKCIEGHEATPGCILLSGDHALLTISADRLGTAAHALRLNGKDRGNIVRLRDEKLLMITGGYTVEARVDFRNPHAGNTPPGALLIKDQLAIYAAAGTIHERYGEIYSFPSGQLLRGSDHGSIAFTTWQLHLCDPQGNVSQQPLLTVHAQDNN